MTGRDRPQTPAFDRAVVRAAPRDTAEVDRLWECTTTRPKHGRSRTTLIVRDARSGSVLGAAEYVRVFPPEDAVWSVVVAPPARRKGLGLALLRALTEAALRDGVRNLATFVPFSAEASWRLLAALDLPVRLYRLDDSAYVEIDLVHLLRERTLQLEQLPGERRVRQPVQAPMVVA